MKSILFTYILLFISINIFAQQDPQFSHNMFNLMGSNPAYAGKHNEICTKVLSRRQWMGIDGAPATTLFSINAPVKPFGINSGIGLTIYDDRIGFEKNFNANLALAYHHEIGTGRLSFGINIGMFNKSIEGDWIAPESIAGDNAIPVEKDQHLSFDLGIGLFYQVGDLYAGISSTHLTQPNMKFNTVELPYLKRHYFLMSGYNIELYNSLIDFSPTMFIKTDGTSSQFSFNINIMYNKKFWGGVTYRTGDAIVLLAGIELFNGIKIGYAYDITTSKLNSAGGSHEVMLGYCFSFEISGNPQKYKSVKYL